VEGVSRVGGNLVVLPVRGGEECRAWEKALASPCDFSAAAAETAAAVSASALSLSALASSSRANLACSLLSAAAAAAIAAAEAAAADVAAAAAAAEAAAVAAAAAAGVPFELPPLLLLRAVEEERLAGTAAGPSEAGAALPLLVPPLTRLETLALRCAERPEVLALRAVGFAWGCAAIAAAARSASGRPLYSVRNNGTLLCSPTATLPGPGMTTVLGGAKKPAEAAAEAAAAARALWP
jgi:hypothetical protein